MCMCVTHLEGNICIIVHAKYFWIVRERQSVHVLPVLLDGVLVRSIVQTCIQTELGSLSEGGM